MKYKENIKAILECYFTGFKEEIIDSACNRILEQEPCEMTVEEYRQKMIQTFHNADCDGLIAVCVLPTEKGFEHLEWLLKNHYKKEPCEDTISRQAVKEQMIKYGFHAPDMTVTEFVEDLPPVTPCPCEDIISRQAVLDEAFEADTKEYGRIEVVGVDVIDALPPVMPQPKTGHWIMIEDRTDWYDATYKCSCCGREIIIPYESRNDLYKNYPYCHCGAKMQEVEE